MKRETATEVILRHSEEILARRNEMATFDEMAIIKREMEQQLRWSPMPMPMNPFLRGVDPVGPTAITPEKVDKPEAKGTQVEVDDEYLALSESVGVDSPIVADELLKRCLKAERIFVYNTEHVEKYLKSMFTKSNQQLVWKALRKKDVDDMRRPLGIDPLYNRAIPGHALAKADKLIQAFDRPDDLCFEVSDYEDVRPDPFLSVRIKNSDSRFVIAYWDEPNFRMEE